MANSEAHTFAMSRYGSDRFDLVEANIRYIRELVKEADMPVEMHKGEELGPFGKSAPHIYDPKQAILDELNHASELVAEACQVCQRVMAELP